MTNTFTFTATPDDNGAMAIPWLQGKLDAFGQFPALIVRISRLPTQNYSFLDEMPLTQETILNIYGLKLGEKIIITAIKG